MAKQREQKPVEWTRHLCWENTKRCDVVRAFHSIHLVGVGGKSSKNDEDCMEKREREKGTTSNISLSQSGMQSIETPNTTLFKRKNGLFRSDNLCFKWKSWNTKEPHHINTYNTHTRRRYPQRPASHTKRTMRMANSWKTLYRAPSKQWRSARDKAKLHRAKPSQAMPVICCSVRHKIGMMSIPMDENEKRSEFICSSP